MQRLSEPARRLFVQYGQRGGRTRARRLGPSRRSAIAARAARARWQKQSQNPSMISVRLAAADWADPVYLAEILSEGTLSDWRVLYRRAADRPFGTTSQALTKVLHAESIYGVTPLWRGILRRIQGNYL